jgi:acyl-CoA thioester hydrolase
MREPLGRYPVSVTIQVAWGDMDAFQHVNNVAFARWQETARVAYLTRLGLMERVRTEGIGPIVARLSVDFRRPLTFPDSVRVDATVTRVGRSSFTLAYRFVSQAQEQEVASGEDVIVVVDYRTGKSTPVDDALRARIAALEGGAEGSS